MTVVLPLSGLAQTRLFSARGGAGESAADGRRVGNRLSTTCSGVRTRGARVNTVATVAILFRLAFRPLARRAEGWGTPLGLTMGMPLPSTTASRMAPAAVSGERCR